MKATRKVRPSKRSKSKSRRRSNKARRQRRPPQLASSTRAEDQAHNEGACLHRSEPELSLPNRASANDVPDDGGAIAASPAEHAFFAVTVDRSAAEPVHDDAEPLLLRPEQLERRLWFRRQVARLMTGVAAFSVITTAIRIASSG